MDDADLGPAMSLAAARDAHKEPLAALEARVARLEQAFVRLAELLERLSTASAEQARLFGVHLEQHDF